MYKEKLGPKYKKLIRIYVWSLVVPTGVLSAIAGYTFNEVVKRKAEQAAFNRTFSIYKDFMFDEVQEANAIVQSADKKLDEQIRNGQNKLKEIQTATNSALVDRDEIAQMLNTSKQNLKESQDILAALEQVELSIEEREKAIVKLEEKLKEREEKLDSKMNEADQLLSKLDTKEEVTRLQIAFLRDALIQTEIVAAKVGPLLNNLQPQRAGNGDQNWGPGTTWNGKED